MKNEQITIRNYDNSLLSFIKATIKTFSKHNFSLEVVNKSQNDLKRIFVKSGEDVLEHEDYLSNFKYQKLKTSMKNIICLVFPHDEELTKEIVDNFKLSSFSKYEFRLHEEGTVYFWGILK